ARAERQVTGWVAISVRLPPRADGPVTFSTQEPAGWHPTPRSQLVLDPFTAAVVKWEPFAGQGLGRRLRAWVRPLHTGEAGRLAGQTVAFVASAGGAVLVWTGIALAWRRFRSWRRRVRSPGTSLGNRAGQEVSAD
ncbi:MAG: PepSY domain-containing protein, partial [Candidatus Rokuibacteriota bacterium]